MIHNPPAADAGRINERVFVTPAIAAEWIEIGRERERPLRPGKVRQYVTDMLAGNWYDNGQTIGFGTDGKRNNGNNRLHAVIAAADQDESFEGVWMDVAWNADGRGIDVGAGRTYGDHLAIEGTATSRNVAKNLATIARFAYMWDGGARSAGGSRVPVPTHTQLDVFVDDYRDLFLLAAERSLMLYSRSHQLISAGTFGMAYFLIARKYNAQVAEDFLMSVALGANLAEYSPAFKLRQTMTSAKGKRLDQWETLAYVLRAWIAHRDHRPVGRLQHPKGGLNIDNYPEP